MASGLNHTELDEWKKCYVPKKEDGSFSQCSIKVFGNEKEFWNMTTRFSGCHHENENFTIVGCKMGWEFDRSEFIETLPSRNEWV